MKRKYRCALAALLVLLSAGPARAEGWGSDEPFPRPRGLEPDVSFWTRIYTEVGTDGGLIHDSRDLGVVYEVVQLPDGLSRRGRERFTESRKQRYREILNSLARGKRSQLSAEQARVLALFPEDVSNATLASAARHLRFQLGQADKFRAGVIRSGAYIDHVRETLTEMGLPQDIAALPHVESSYTPHAWSRVGAAGLWQFTRSTGRRYMRVDHVVDERLDPHRATIAAARLLENNYRVTGSWPLAITAYNHGAAGMRRAIRKLGTRDVETIVRNYKSRTFGFASRNFYVEFLAAAQIARNPERYFGPLVQDEPIPYESMELPFYTSAAALARAIEVDVTSLRVANPALLSPVWSGQKRVPRGFEIRVPRSELARPLSVALETIPSEDRYAQQTRDTYHVVRRGETLSGIAKHYGLGLGELKSLNSLRSSHHIRIGQKLRLPSDHAPSAQVLASSTPPPDGRYTVRRGDTLSKIATRFGMGEQELAAANGLRNRHQIYAGQVLRVTALPDQAEPSAQLASASTDTPTEPTESALATGAELEPKPDSRQLAGLAPRDAGEPTSRLDRAPASEPATGSLPDEADEAGSGSGELAAEDEEPPSEALFGEEAVGVAASSGDVSPAEAEVTKLLADPNDYSVAADGTIEIHAAETLGHYAEWLDLRASRLRALNDLSYGETLPVHSRIRLDFGQVSPEEFERRRVDYHRAMQETFFSEWEIAGVETHRMRRGDSLWVLSHRRFNVPMWLLRQYNPDLDFEALSAGSEITVPLLKRREWEEGTQSGASLEASAASRAGVDPSQDRES